MKERGRAGEEPISDEDLLKLLRVSEDAILVGGQALAFWVAYFGVEIAPGPRPFISSDADFLGLARHVAKFAAAVGGRAEYPSRRRITALQGVVTKQTPGGTRISVDVLGSVVGLPADAVSRRAVAMRHHRDPSLSFKVMSPTDCLVSRFENLRQLEDKQNEIGIWQAGISIAVCRAYLETLIAMDDERAAIRAATKILEIAGTAPGLQAFRRYGLEPLDGIPIGAFASRTFRNEQYARTTARVRGLRAAYRPPPKVKRR